MGVMLKNPIGYKMLCRAIIGICDVLNDPDKHYKILCTETIGSAKEEIYFITTFSEVYSRISCEAKINRSRLDEVLQLLEKRGILYTVSRNDIKEFPPFRNTQCVTIHIPQEKFEKIKEARKWRPNDGKIKKIADVTVDDLVEVAPSRTKFIVIPRYVGGSNPEMESGSGIGNGFYTLRWLKRCCKTIQRILLCGDS